MGRKSSSPRKTISVGGSRIEDNPFGYIFTSRKGKRYLLGRNKKLNRKELAKYNLTMKKGWTYKKIWGK